MKPIPRYLVTDSGNSLTLGVGDTEATAVAASAETIKTSHNPNPRRVVIHDLDPKGYKRRVVVVGVDGLVSK